MAMLDPVCAFHGKRRSEHECLVCCLCFRDLTPEECHVLDDGSGEREDVCNKCFEHEAEMMRLFHAGLNAAEKRP